MSWRNFYSVKIYWDRFHRENALFFSHVTLFGHLNSGKAVCQTAADHHVMFPELPEFVTVNRFFFDAVQNPEHKTMDDVAGCLGIGLHSLRNSLIKWRVPTRFSSLRKRISEIALTSIGPPPPVYTAYYNSLHIDQMLDDQALELLKPVTPFHFDYSQIILTRFTNVSPSRLALLTGPWLDSIPFDDNWDTNYFPDSETRSFRQTLCNYYSRLPACLRDLDNDQLFRVNADLAVAFLHASVSFPIPGIASPHLKGAFLLGLRKQNTGYLSVNCDCPAATQIGSERWQAILAWYREHNDLYKDFTPITSDTFDLRLNTASTAVAAIEIPGAQHGFTDACGQVCLTIRNEDGSTAKKSLPLERALALTFPVLFPYGLPVIPAKTLRKKARLILAAHPYYRCGRVQCHLALFLYHVIQDYALAFHRTKLSIQPVALPEGANRLIDAPPTYRDPSSPAYWNERQAEVRAMCQQYGDPDLMLTFTFVNKWPEVHSVEAAIADGLGRQLDLRFCPLECMMIWKHRFADVRANDFRQLLELLGFPPPIQYTWRLEFQSRGAPHVHALLWLSERLSLASLPSHLFASVPPLQYPQLWELVTHNMIHTCTLARCKRGDPTRQCRYGFPKPATDLPSLNEDGSVRLARTPRDKWVVEYSPAFLFKWHGHAHMHVLRTLEHPDCSPNALFYVVKYNFKHEPSLRVDLHQGDTYDTLFHARIISSEEALARIFSFQFHGASATFTYLSLQPPESRSAAFIGGVQIQVPDVDKYFLRPPPLDRLSIFSFFSLYDVSAASETNEQRSRCFTDLDRLCFARTRPPLTLTSNHWEDANLAPLSFVPFGLLFNSTILPAARALNCTLRSDPKIVIPPKLGLSTNTDTAAYAFLLLNSPWRSDAELRAGQSSWRDALRFHGLSPPDVPEIYTYSCRLFEYMLTSCRYSSRDLAAAITRMSADITPFVQTLQETCDPSLRPVLRKVLEELPNPTTMPCVDLDDPVPSCDPGQYITCNFTPAAIAQADTLLRQRQPCLCPDQATVFNHVRAALDANIVFSFFISGKAGTGKSFLISCLQSLFTMRSIPYVTCASTGIAATLIGGNTLHSTFGLFTTTNDETICSLDISRPRGYAISLCKVIIVDEVTMISRGVMNALDAGLRRLAGQSNKGDPTLPFGGKCVILVGDLAQVPAVVHTRDDFSESSEQFFASTPYSSFTRFALTQVMRQSPDEVAFLTLLDEIRDLRDQLSPASITLLRSRFVPGDVSIVVDTIDSFVGRDDPRGMVSTFTNARASYYNQLILDRRPGIQVTLHAKFYVRQASSFRHRLTPDSDPAPDLPPPFTTVLATDAQIRLFRAAFKKRKYNTIVPFSLAIAPGARVMLLQNLDVHNGLINGTRGSVVSYDADVDAILVHFDSQDTHSPPTVISRTETVRYPLARGSTIFMFQFPLKTCWACTAHKSQGQSLERVAVDISDHAFAHGSLYVALSRVRTINGLLLFGLDEFPAAGPSFHVNQFIQEQDHDQAFNE